MKMFKFTFCVLFFILFTQIGYSQYIIEGKILNSKNEPISGATILEKNTTNGTFSDTKGYYKLNCEKENPTVIVQYLGFKTLELVANKTKNNMFFNIVLEEKATDIEAITIVVGSRNKNRTSTESMAPVDVIDVNEVAIKNGQIDINQMLQYAAPSFNSNRQSGSDGADHIDPASLRGLGPDQTLVLINGKRQHQSALVNLYGSRGRGNTGTDLNTIPASAIERIEILRDGAAAQYGSDAIAGVINVILKKNVDEGQLNVGLGGYEAKYRYDDKKIDGSNYTCNFNYGISILEKGYLNITVDRNTRNHTNRANTGHPEFYRREYGDAALTNTSVYLNSKFPINDKIHIYGLGGYNKRKGEAFAWSRFADDDRNIKSIYPNGFDPIIKSDITDYSLCVGANAQLSKNNVLDISNTNGSNMFDYSLSNTLNRSIGENSPRKFEAGGFSLKQNTTNVSFTHYMPKLLSGSSIAVGYEYRKEDYEIVAGEEESYRAYIDTLPPGSQGFPGFQPSDEVNARRTNQAFYADLEVDLTKKLSIGAALRNENYSDFGTTLNWKLSSRYKLTNTIAIRATTSTGFRAPSLPQMFFNSTITNFIAGEPVEVLIASNNGNVAEALGIPKLKEETSKNYSLGFTFNKGGVSFTVDAYQIDVNDRIVLTGSFKNDDDVIGDTLKALNVGQAQFFTNAVNTTTQGLDAILSISKRINLTKISWMGALNLNQLKINKVYTNELLKGKEETYFDLRERNFLIMSAPPIKATTSLDVTHKKLNFNLRATYFGEVKLTRWTYDPNDPDIYTPKVVFDASSTVTLIKKLQLTAGINNLFNTYPDMKDPAFTEGGGAWDAVQMGTNGRLFFAKLRYSF
jgi:iron complex outermembrane receptor protein